MRGEAKLHESGGEEEDRGNKRSRVGGWEWKLQGEEENGMLCVTEIHLDSFADVVSFSRKLYH